MITGENFRTVFRGLLGILLVAGAYEWVARAGHFPPTLLPTLPKIGTTLWSMLADGSMLGHVMGTLARVMMGFGLAVVIAIPLGILMGRYRPIEKFFMPLVSALMPIPSLAWVPVFILWLGIGSTVAVVIVLYAALFPLVLNTWAGVKAVNPLWFAVTSGRPHAIASIRCRPNPSPMLPFT